MSFTVSSGRRVPVGGAIAVGVHSDSVGDAAALRSDLPGGSTDVGWAYLSGVGFEAKPGQVQVVPSTSGGRAVIFVGLGERAKLDTSGLRRAAVAATRAASRHQALGLHLHSGGVDERVDPIEAAQAVAEGAVLGAYRFDRLRSEKQPVSLARAVVVGSGRSHAAAVALGARVGQAVCEARDLVNRPGGELLPEVLAAEARAIAKREGLAVKVLDERAIRAARLGGLLGVNRGSTHPPCLIQMTYTPPGRVRGALALVGKGLTFDAGGLSIKTAEGMATMKCDMAGAAAVLAAMGAVPSLAPPVKVSAWVPATDNMLGGDAMRPGDVLTIRNGRTVEVLNTDAEGRLILADALTLAGEAKPDAIVDLATLTGACMVALGEKIAGVMGNHDGFVTQVRAAADRSGERVWPLPLPDDYRKQLDSSVADLKNIGTRYGGTLTAGLFLREFVPEGVPWAHLDIAGPAWTDAETDDSPKGATGFGVRLLLELIRRFERP